jgi:methylated-DNA-protein-cysteine methyltransferase-like protein
MPTSANRSAIPAPSPRLAPVMTATRPATSGAAPTLRSMTRFEQAVVRVLQSLGPGEVVTYGEVAAEAGFPGRARAVGNILATSDGDLPWWRVVTSTGRLVPGHEAEHARRLRAEGVAVVDGRVPAGGSRG